MTTNAKQHRRPRPLERGDLSFGRGAPGIMHRLRRPLAILALFVVTTAVDADPPLISSPATAATTNPSASIPTRKSDAPGGTALLQSLADQPTTEREAAIAVQLITGNVPDRLRRFRTVRLSATTPDGATHTADVQVAPDYLAVGSNDDFVRVPLTPRTARRIADAFGCTLPTRQLVDAIDCEADVRLEPRPLTERREAVETFTQHNAIIEEQRKGQGQGIVSGIKKDVVLTNRLRDKPGRVAIYGWRRLDGSPIQPLTTVHVERYVDYSHGVRLVLRQMLVDGKPTTVDAVLKDPILSVLLSDEGPIDTAGLYADPPATEP